MMNKKEYANIGETLYEGVLPNGLKVQVVPKEGYSSYYAVFGTNYGGAMRNFELDGEKISTPAGVAHFLEHKMFDLPDGDNALSLLSENGADPNAFTSSGITCYYFKCTTGFEKNLRMLLHFVSTPYFTPETVDKEQGIIGQEIRMTEDSPGTVLYYNLLSCLYENHPIKDKVAGTIDSISEITDKTLYDCHRVFYAPSNMVLCVEGDVNPEDIFRIAEEELTSELSPVPHADYGAAEGPLPVRAREDVHMEVSRPVFFIGSKVDGEDTVRSRMVASLALQTFLGRSSEFFTRLYEQGTLNSDFDAECDYSAGTSTVIIGGESGDPDAVLRELNAAVSAVSFDSEYFERIKKSNIGGRLRSLESFDEVCISLASGYFDGYCAFDAFALLNDISREECEDWIRDNLREEKLAISIVRP